MNKREKHTGKFNFFSKNFADHGFGSGSALQRHIRIRSQGANWMQIYSMWIRMRNTGSSFPLPTLYFVSILYTVRRSSSLCASLVHSRVLFPWGNPHRETPPPNPTSNKVAHTLLLRHISCSYCTHSLLAKSDIFYSIQRMASISHIPIQ
jgi:hypothetical protein